MHLISIWIPLVLYYSLNQYRQEIFIEWDIKGYYHDSLHDKFKDVMDVFFSNAFEKYLDSSGPIALSKYHQKMNIEWNIKECYHDSLLDRSKDVMDVFLSNALDKCLNPSGPISSKSIPSGKYT